MRNQKSPARLVAEQAVTEYKDYPSRSIATLLYEKEPKLFSSVEQARDIVRIIRGTHGEAKSSQRTKELSGIDTAGVNTLMNQLPDPIDDLFTWDNVRVQFKRALILQDVHLPFHDKSALSLALNHGKKCEVDCIIINGDLMDFFQLSDWERDPRMRDFQREVEIGKRFLECLRDIFPKAQIIYKEGNHEERLWRYGWKRYPEMYGLRGGDGKVLVSLSTVMDLDEYGITLVDNKRPILAGEHLYILHGHEFRMPLERTVNPARGLYNRAKANCLCGHVHQTTNHTEPGLERVVSTWSGGCLCTLHPQWMPINKWNHGFKIVHLDGNAWSVDNRKIINGNIV